MWGTCSLGGNEVLDGRGTGLQDCRCELGLYSVQSLMNSVP